MSDNPISGRGGVGPPDPTGEGEEVKIGVVVAHYDVATDPAGGAQGTKHLGVKIPPNSVIILATYKVMTTFTSSGDLATIAISSGETSDDLVAAIAINDGTDPWDDPGALNKSCIPDGTGANSILVADPVSTSEDMFLEVGTEDLTAGKLIVTVVFWHPANPYGYYQ